MTNIMEYHLIRDSLDCRPAADHGRTGPRGDGRWPDAGEHPHLAARLIGATAAARDRIGLTPWPAVAEAARRTIERLPGGSKAQIQPAEGASHLLKARTGGQVSEVDDGEVVRFEY